MKRVIMMALVAPALLSAQRDTAQAREAYLTGRQAIREKSDLHARPWPSTRLPA